MKPLILMLLLVLQTIASAAAQAWSPLEDVETFAGKMQNCYFTIAGSEDDQESNNQEGEEEEEPDCD